MEQLRPFLLDLQNGSGGASPRVSGDMAAHYAPRTPLNMLCREELIKSAAKLGAVVLCLNDLPAGLIGVALDKDAEAYAQGFYASLRWLDEQQAGCILIEHVPCTDDWLAINDRINRAITGSGASKPHG